MLFLWLWLSPEGISQPAGLRTEPRLGFEYLIASLAERLGLLTNNTGELALPRLGLSDYGRTHNFSTPGLQSEGAVHVTRHDDASWEGH